MAREASVSVGVSDIGLEGSKVETNLQKVFDLAGLWKAVLLLYVSLRLVVEDGILTMRSDEADVFLDARDTHRAGIQRSTIVSVSYLDQKQKESILMEFLTQFKQNGLINPTRWESIKSWVEEEGRNKVFNGRQIRDIVSTAMGLAHAKHRKLEGKDFSLVAMNRSAFKNSLAAQEAVFENNQLKAMSN
ncbi:hypothetical protein DL771_003789 [Monosporascus sp. 5C6A]|nr:hypothetical protein DL771_003789 [Monosporascus sp. 5C6A]